MASIDTHIKFAGVEGESPHQDHKGGIEVLSWTWGASNSSSQAGGGSGSGKAVPGELHFTHFYDKASPILGKYCIAGRHFDEVTMTARKAGDGQMDFLVVKMKEVFITTIQPSGCSGGDIVEHVSCSYKQIDFVYKAQDEQGGLGGEVKLSWNTATTDVT